MPEAAGSVLFVGGCGRLVATLAQLEGGEIRAKQSVAGNWVAMRNVATRRGAGVRQTPTGHGLNQRPLTTLHFRFAQEFLVALLGVGLEKLLRIFRKRRLQFIRFSGKILEQKRESLRLAGRGRKREFI